MIVQAGIKRLVAKQRYQADKLSLKLFKEAKIGVKILSQKITRYPRKGN